MTDIPYTSKDPPSWPLRNALQTARRVLDGELGVIEGCIALSACAHDVVSDWRADPDFVLFGAIASETDHLPFGDVRDRWSPVALEKADAEIDAIVEANRTTVRRACENLIARFSCANP